MALWEWRLLTSPAPLPTRLTLNLTADQHGSTLAQAVVQDCVSVVSLKSSQREQRIKQGSLPRWPHAQSWPVWYVWVLPVEKGQSDLGGLHLGSMGGVGAFRFVWRKRRPLKTRGPAMS